MIFDKLSREVVESGREHPFVQALLRELRDRLHGLRDSLVMAAGTSQHEGADRHLCQLGGRAFQLNEVVWMIAKAEGMDRE